MWFIGVEVEQETSAPPPKKILDPPLRCVKTWRQQSVPCTLNGLVSKEEETFVWYNNSSITFHCFHISWGRLIQQNQKTTYIYNLSQEQIQPSEAFSRTESFQQKLTMLNFLCLHLPVSSSEFFLSHILPLSE